MTRLAENLTIERVRRRLGTALLQLPAICRSHHVRRLGVFGSVVSDRFNSSTSDIDFVVDFEPGYSLPWMAHVSRLRDDLTSLLHRPVDILPQGATGNPYLQREVDADAVIIIDRDRLLLEPGREPSEMNDSSPYDPLIRKSIEDIIAACEQLDSVRSSRSLADYRSDQLLRWGVERAFTIIGEAINRIRKRNDALADRITAARSIIAFRNLIVHEYDMVDDDIVWTVMADHVPKLLTEARSLLQTLPKD